MSKPQHAILRFAKYKGPAISQIEAHNERTKVQYASNPDIDTSRSAFNYHLITPAQKYRLEANEQISASGCRTRTDSVRLVEALITGSPDFFKSKTDQEIRKYFEYSLDFLKQRQRPDTFVSAVVHLDEKTPHMHVTFVPLTQDGRLSAKEIIGNKKQLIAWQDAYWEHMVSKYPDLERGQSASETGRTHIPPRLFKKMTHLTKQKQRLSELLQGMNVFNYKDRMKEISIILDRYIPDTAQMRTELKKYKAAFTETISENKELKTENEKLYETLDQARRGSVFEKMQHFQLERDLEEACALIERIPPEVIKEYTKSTAKRKVVQKHEVL